MPDVLVPLNLFANSTIFLGSLWLVLTQKVPTRSGSALFLWFVNFAALGNLTAVQACHSEPEVLLNVAMALAMLYGFWMVEVRGRPWRLS